MVPRYSGVDSDAVWVGNAREGALDHFRFSLGDIGPIGQYGTPIQTNNSKIPYNYQSGPLNNELKSFDVYLVDGRYRVSCACASFLHAWSRGGDMTKILVVVHDWNRGKVATHYDPNNETSWRSEWAWGYWILMDIADVVEKSELLAVLKLKPGIAEQDVHNLWLEHLWDRR